MNVCCESCVLSGRVLFDRPIPCPDECYRLLCVIFWNVEPSQMKWACPTLDNCNRENKILLNEIYIEDGINKRITVFQIHRCLKGGMLQDMREQIMSRVV